MPTTPTAPNPANHLYGKGALYFDRFAGVGGARQGLYHLGNCDQFQLNIAVQKAQLRTSMDESNALLNDVVTQVDPTFTIRGFDFNKKNLAIALLGEETSYSQVGTAVTGEVLTTSVRKGAIYQTAFRKIASVTVTQQPSTTLVLNTDYRIVDAEAGLIQILASSTTATDGSEIRVSYTPAAMTGATATDLIRGGTRTQIEGKLLYVPRNVSGPQWEITVYRASIAPSAAIDLISSDFAPFTLSGAILDDSAGAYGGSVASPYYQALLRG